METWIQNGVTEAGVKPEEKPYFTKYGTFVLTIDNIFKMNAIQSRLQSSIPVTQLASIEEAKLAADRVPHAVRFSSWARQVAGKRSRSAISPRSSGCVHYSETLRRALFASVATPIAAG